MENQKLFRVSRLEEHNLIRGEDQVIAQLQTLAPRAQGSSFRIRLRRGDTSILEVVHQLAKQHSLLLFGDLQCSSQVARQRFE